MIRDQVVEKCYSKKLKERLLQQDTLDLDNYQDGENDRERRTRNQIDGWNRHKRRPHSIKSPWLDQRQR